MLFHGADRQVKLHGNLHIAHMLIPAHHEDRPALWRKGFDSDFALVEDILFLRSRNDAAGFAYAVPLGNLERGLELLQEHCKKTGEPLRFFSVSEENKEAFGILRDSLVMRLENIPMSSASTAQ